MKPHPRIIPILLLSNKGLYKTTKYKNPIYVGDPLNTLKIFNEKEADEIIIIDISASKQKKEPDFKYLEEIVSECFMPICYGGGIKTLSHIKQLFEIGIEKITLNSILLKDPQLVKQAVEIYGSQSIVGVVDINKSVFGKFYLYDYQTKKKVKKNIFEYIKFLEELGIGELLINFVHKENTSSGYEIELTKKISQIVTIPIIANGGVGCFEDLKKGINVGNASAAAAGSFFVFQGPHKAVLITYPKYEKIISINE